VEATDFKNVIQNIVFVFDKISKGMLGNLRKSWGNIFNDYIFEISGFH
jgi:hypothetical protein